MQKSKPWIIVKGNNNFYCWTVTEKHAYGSNRIQKIVQKGFKL